MVICVDEFGPLNLQSAPGRLWAVAGGGAAIAADAEPPTGAWPVCADLLAAYDLSTDPPRAHRFS